MLIAALDTKLPVVSIQDVSIRHEHNAFRKYGFYAWRNEEKTVLNTHYATFKNAEEAKKFVKDNVNLNHCSFEDYWIASRILHENGALDSKKHWKTLIPIGLMLRKIPGVTSPVYTRYFDHRNHNWIAHFYEYAHHNKKLGDSKGAESLREAADILSRLV